MAQISILFYFKILFVLAALGFRCCAGAFFSCSERELLFVVVCGLLIVVASLVVGSRCAGFNSCGAQAK